MEPLEDSHYLEPPAEVDWCDYHDQAKPCEWCLDDDADSRFSMRKER